jgi:hypothetical protein
MRHADTVGLEPAEPRIDFGRVNDHVWRAIRTIEPQAPERLRVAGVEVIESAGRFIAPGRIEAHGRELRWRTAIIATGSEPVIAPVPGLAEAEPLTTDTMWELRELPGRLVVLGGGPVGCELAQAFARLGSQVALVEMADRLLLKEEPRASTLVAERLRADGVAVRTAARATAVRGGELLLDGGRVRSHPRRYRPGRAHRRPRARRRGGARRRARRRDRRSAAAHERTGHLRGRRRDGAAAVHARSGARRARGRLQRLVSCALEGGVEATVAHVHRPRVGRVGLTEAQARERWRDRVVTAESDYARLDCAIAAGEPYGFAKLVGDPRGRLVGATVAAPGGGEAIAELTEWISRGEKIDAVSRTVHAYPTLAEGPARAADHHLAARYSSPRLRAVARPVLATLRAPPLTTRERRGRDPPVDRQTSAAGR